MDGVNLVDIIVCVLVVLSALLAYSRGLIRELMAIAGWVISGILSFIFAPHALPLIKEIPVIGPILGDSCELALIAAFAGIFALCLLIMSFFTPLFSSMIQKSKLNKADQSLGFIFGVLRGILFVAIAFFAYKSIFAPNSIPMLEQSRSADIFSSLVIQIEEQNPQKGMEWLPKQFDALIIHCDK